ncbi:MAG TPA: cytochrome c [Steroidobacteraceae bacterium]|nr:cytochrome c [Steroidobacteraceae bacterium]
MSSRTSLLVASLCACVSGAALAAGAPPPGPGWTGLTKPKDVIHARGELMDHMEELMRPIDTITVTPGPVKNVDQLHFNAEVVGAILTAVPHLFPPTTNLYDPKSTSPETIALPGIWQNWDSFYRLAQAAAKSAEEFAQTTGGPQLRAASRRLRASCDACHTLYLRKYESPKVQSSDYQFDFNSVLPPKK